MTQIHVTNSTCPNNSLFHPKIIIIKCISRNLSLQMLIKQLLFLSTLLIGTTRAMDDGAVTGLAILWISLIVVCSCIAIVAPLAVIIWFVLRLRNNGWWQENGGTIIKCQFFNFFCILVYLKNKRFVSWSTGIAAGNLNFWAEWRHSHIFLGRGLPESPLYCNGADRDAAASGTAQTKSISAWNLSSSARVCVAAELAY